MSKILPNKTWLVGVFGSVNVFEKLVFLRSMSLISATEKVNSTSISPSVSASNPSTINLALILSVDCL